MSVFLLILKIIGIVLLVILGLIVVIALLALFCPFVYRVKGSYHEKNLQLQVRIWWLGRLLGLCADTAEEGFHTYVRIFGFRKELHLQKEKEDSADFKKPVQEDSPQEGIKDRETEVAPSLRRQFSVIRIKKRKHFFRAGLQVLSGSSRKRSGIFCKRFFIF